MKKLITIINLLLLIVLVSGGSNNRLKSISESIELDVSNCKIEKDIDTHGGFLGDGDFFAKIICTADVDNEIQSNWKELPLSSELQQIMEMIQYNNDGGNNVYDKYGIPKLESGYYYFHDRHSDSKDINDDSELNSRSSYNFSIGIYDIENKIIYYYELDT